jgi:integrase/recombinase XerD
VALSVSQSLYADLFQRTWAQSKYLDAPLLEERTNYISHLLKQGVPRNRIRGIASAQITAIKLLDMRHSRPIDAREVQEAGFQWARDMELQIGKRPGKSTSHNFTRMVTKWLEFSGLLVKSEVPGRPLDFAVMSYLEQLRLEGLAESTIRLRRYHLSQLQMWLSERRNKFAEVSLDAIDDYVDSQRAKGRSQRTLRNNCAIIRWFFRFCESRNWCKAGIARGILMPRVIKPFTGPRGPAWKDVRRMIRVESESPIELRVNAIVSLCSIYALRNSEILHLRLDDLDWFNEIMTVRRAKRGPVQHFPIQHEVGEAILAYLNSARPRSSCRYLFTSFRAPIRPMGATCIQQAVAKRMKTLGIKSQTFGPHALRHSCATHLLSKGFSLPEIADFLGHRGLHSVSVYAKYNPRLLRRVASFTLAGIQ